jgi:predicted metal-dependent peptidase
MTGKEAHVVTLQGLGWDRSYTPSRNELLEWLRQHQQETTGNGSDQDQDQDKDQDTSGWGYDPNQPELQREAGATPEELERAHQEFLDKAAKEAGRQAAAQRPLPHGDYEKAAEVAATVRAAAQAVEWAAYKVGTWRMPVRTWTREGRTPELRGQARLPRLRMAVLLDVSGSMNAHLPMMLALAELLRVRGEVQVIAFSAQAVEVATAEDIQRIAGGGTCLAPAVELASGADAAVIITDGAIADGGLTLPWPSVWVLTDGGTLPEVRTEWPPVVLPLGKGGTQ